MSIELLSHYHTITQKNVSNGVSVEKKYNIYYVYNYILPH